MKTNSKALVVLNTITFALMLVVNCGSNTNMFGNITVADVAHKYDTLFAPADYAFIIWSLVFLLCAGFVIYQWILLRKDVQQYIKRTGLWFAVSNIVNALWIYCWINELLGISVLLILILLLSLVKLTINLRLELDDEPVRHILFVWWPVSIYLGWIIAATVACIAAWLVSIGWKGFGLAADIWTIIMIVIAFVIYIFLQITRNMRESAAVGIWAFIAIAVRQWNDYTSIVLTGMITAAVLGLLILMHAFKNRKYLPFLKLKRGEW